jgi:hypothetical protein
VFRRNEEKTIGKDGNAEKRAGELRDFCLLAWGERSRKKDAALKGRRYASKRQKKRKEKREKRKEKREKRKEKREKRKEKREKRKERV